MLGNHAWFSFSVFLASVPGPAVFWEGVIQFHFIRGRLALLPLPLLLTLVLKLAKSLQLSSTRQQRGELSGA